MYDALVGREIKYSSNDLPSLACSLQWERPARIFWALRIGSAPDASSAANVAMLAVSAADAQRDVLSSMDCRRPCAQRFTQDAGSRAMRGPCFFAKSIKSADLTCVCRHIEPSGSIAEPADAQEASSSKIIEAPAGLRCGSSALLGFRLVSAFGVNRTPEKGAAILLSGICSLPCAGQASRPVTCPVGLRR